MFLPSASSNQVKWHFSIILHSEFDSAHHKTPGKRTRSKVLPCLIHLTLMFWSLYSRKEVKMTSNHKPPLGFGYSTPENPVYEFLKMYPKLAPQFKKGCFFKKYALTTHHRSTKTPLLTMTRQTLLSKARVSQDHYQWCIFSLHPWECLCIWDEVGHENDSLSLALQRDSLCKAVVLHASYIAIPPKLSLHEHGCDDSGVGSLKNLRVWHPALPFLGSSNILRYYATCLLGQSRKILALTQ